MHGFKFLIVSLIAVFFVNFSYGNDSSLLPSNIIVKIQTVRNPPNYQQPWQNVGQHTTHGTGFIISHDRILTNAHVVSDSVFIHVRQAGKTKKFSAEVEYFDHESDLAILNVADKDFFKDVEAYPIGALSNVRDKVAVYGFPDGGDKLSITEGVVSRIEHINYAYSGSFLLSCQIDASINSGNSGGPVIFDNKIVGVAFQGMNSGYDNIGYMIPAPVIKQFLADAEDGNITGIPDLGITMQKLESPYLRKFYKLDADEHGALINKISIGSPSESFLKSEDVILSVDGADVAYDGTIEFRKGQRTYFGYLIQNKQIGDIVTLAVKRNGQTLEIEIPLKKAIGFNRLVPFWHEVRPKYYIYGGIVFQPLTLNYLTEFGAIGDWFRFAPVELMNFYLNGELKYRDQEIVILSAVLADNINIGYHELAENVLKTVNGITVKNFSHFIELVENNEEEYLSIIDTQGTKIILDRQVMDENTEDVIEKYMIKSAKQI